MSSSFKTKIEFETRIEQFPFTEEGISELKINSKHSEDWPVVYILNGDEEAYIGETQSAFDRMKQHLANRNTLRRNLTRINLMQSESFNKSAILDIENMLITHMHADGKYILQNTNGGQSRLHNYYQRNLYQSVFKNIWDKLKEKNLVVHELYEIENSEIFKFSPYKELTSEQYKIVDELLKLYVEAMKKDKERIDVVVNGGAGTGKSLIAMYFINIIANILSNNYDFTNSDDFCDDESFFNRSDLIKSVKTYGNYKIGFVVAVPSFKQTVEKVFSSIRDLRKIDVISPSEASRGDYDVLIVDEAHRLKRRNRLTNYGTHDRVNHNLGLSINSTELDWVKLKARKMLVLFYDGNQSVKESDVLKEDFDEIINSSSTKQYFLNSQLRIKGGNEYIDFVKKLFSNCPIKYNVQQEYELKVYDDCNEMFREIKEKNTKYGGLCRMLSGISFYWRKKARDKRSTKYKQEYDFEINGHKYCWNNEFNAGDFITNDENIDKIGCIYTTQGHDLNFAGVIFGKDISYDTKEKRIVYNIEEFIDTNAKSKDRNKTEKNIINAYIILLTRGVYGTYIYAVDKNLREYIKSLIKD